MMGEIVVRARCNQCGVEEPLEHEWDEDAEGSRPELCWGDSFVCREFRAETFARIAAVDA